MSANSKGVPMRKPAAAPPIAALQHQKGPKPARKKMAVVGTVYQIDRHRRTPEEVVEALFRAPGAAAPREETAPSRPVPEHQRVRVTLTGPEVVPPVGTSEAMFGWLVEYRTAIRVFNTFRVYVQYQERGERHAEQRGLDF